MSTATTTTTKTTFFTYYYYTKIQKKESENKPPVITLGTNRDRWHFYKMHIDKVRKTLIAMNA